jgi:DAACS family dicarboxylate/amino acid:cation (Na+ or H+) symporter
MRGHHAGTMLVGLVAGATLGITAHLTLADAPILETVVHGITEPIGTVFLRLLFMLVIPLVVSGLSLGVAGVGDVRALGRVAARTFVYTVVLSSLSVLIGVTLVNTLRPGDGISPVLRERLAAQAHAAPLVTVPKAETGIALLVNLVPANPLRAMADGDMLAVMTFAFFLGLGLVLTRTDAARRLEEALQGLFDVVMRLLDVVIRVAPIGVACLVFSLTARLGLEVIRQLAAYVGVVLLALAIQQFVVYSASVQLFGGMTPRAFFRGVREAMLTAFSTSSSNATLPTALRVAEEELHLPPHVARFVLTIGSTANQNGTALFEGVTVLFLAQFYGVDLTFGQQLTVVGICVLGGIGTAGVPGGCIPVIAMMLGTIGVPIEGIGMVLGIDRFLDMCRTTLNVTGDLAAAVVVARGERGAQAPASR